MFRFVKSHFVFLINVLAANTVSSNESCSQEWYNVFVNKIGVVEYRFVIKIDNDKYKSNFCKDMEKVVEEIADTIYKYVPNTKHPSVPIDYLFCGASFNKRKMIFFKQNYSTRFLLNNNEVCIWSFREDKLAGHNLKSAKKITRKIVAAFLKANPGFKIKKIIKVKGTHEMTTA